MKKIALVSLLAVAILAAGGVSDQVWAGGAAGGWHGGGGSWGGGWHGSGWHGGWCCSRVVVGVGVGPFWGYPFWGWPGYYPAYAAYPGFYPGPYYGPAPVAQEPTTYVSQPQLQPAPGPGSSVPEPGYWYYCSSARNYYPNVQSCPELWIKVPPTSQ